MICRIFEGMIVAVNPPITPPIIPKIPNLNPVPTIPSNFCECLYAPLVAVGMMIAKLVPREIRIAKSCEIPMYFSRKYCKGTIKKPPPTPKRPEANPAIIPIRINPK